MHSESTTNEILGQGAAQSASIENLAKAMSQLQAKAIVLGDNATGHNYRYVTLDKVVSRMFPEMAALGLSVVQPLGSIGHEPAIVTILMHESGEWVKSAYPLAKAGMRQVNDAQQLGAAVTYARRYGLLSLLGVPTGDDDDAACLTDSKPASRPTGQKYPPEQGTLVDDLIAEMRNQTDLDSLGKYMKKIKPTVQGLPDFAQKKISAEYMVHRGEVEAREGRQS